MQTANGLMTVDVETVHEDDEVSDVLVRMGRRRFNGFPVVDDAERLVGIVTQSDLTDLFQPHNRTLWIPIGFPPFLESLEYAFDLSWDALDAELDLARNAGKPIGEVMTTDVVTVTPEASLDDLLDVLSDDDRDVNRVPVVDEEERVVGIVTRQDLLRALREERRENG